MNKRVVSLLQGVSAIKTYLIVQCCIKVYQRTITTTTRKLGEKPTCAHLLRPKTYKTYWVELVSVDFEAALHETCFWRECVKLNM